MTMRKILLLLAMVLVQTISTSAQRKEVLLETTEGNIRIALYDETPIHRDNFVKLVKEQTYDSLLFHRVIRDFMIQAGDLKSKHAEPGQRLGSGELNYTLEPEFRLPQLFHKRGAVCAAREGDTRATGPIPNNVLAPVSSTLSGASATATWLSARCRNGWTRRREVAYS